MKLEKKWYQSKKLWVGLITFVLILLSEVLGLDLPAEKILAMAGLALGYILAQAKVDAATRSASINVNKIP